MTYKDRSEIPFTDDEIRLLHKVWLAVHSQRFAAHEPGFDDVDTIYTGILMAERAIQDIAGVELGYSFGWLPELLADVP